MDAIFKINFNTQWGQQLFVCGSNAALGNWNTDKAPAMNYVGEGNWELAITTKSKITDYKYFIKSDNNPISWEGGKNRLFVNDGKKVVEINDNWHRTPIINDVFQTKVFSEVLMKPSSIFKNNTDSAIKKTLRFSMVAPRISSKHRLALLGNQTELGNWIPEKALFLSNESHPTWSIELDISKLIFPIKYKYAIVDSVSKKIVQWEEGEERIVNAPTSQSNDFIYLQNDNDFRHPDHNQWRGAGVAIPVFSLRTNESFGVGEFSDLMKLVDWAKSAGLKVIQLLPINETVATHSWLDSYPYKAISVMALQPMYLNIDKLGKLDNNESMAEFNASKEQLNKLPFVDYIEVTRVKSRYFKLIFDQNWNKVKRSTKYKTFFTMNSDWLEPYAAFCYLRDKFKTSNFREWGEFAKFDRTKIAELTSPKNDFYEHIAVHYYIQFNLDLQLREAVDYAHKNEIALKGDLPIGISPNSIEAWTEPTLFNLNGQAGAPPDDFAVQGQNWGFPTYNWDEMAKDNYAWWRKRLKMMENYFDAYRIDHILGFFRIWEIPKHAIHGLLGMFKPALPLSISEIEDYGIWFDSDRFTKPYIREHFLHELFGEFTQEVKTHYLESTGDNSYKLKPNFDSQQKIYNFFTTAENADAMLEKTVVIRDGLMSLLDEVLFIRDPYTKHLAYHPRINIHDTYSYHELDLASKESINNIYIDFFFKRHEQFWKEAAYRTLPPLIEASNMLVCGEDLGMVPETVPEVLRQLNILSLEIQRMAKDPSIEFGHPADAPYLSVCTTSTHDMSTIRGWWEEDHQKTQRFFNFILGNNGAAPHFAEAWVCTEIIKQHLYSPAMLTIFPIQDLIAMDRNLRWDETNSERINVPSDPQNKWKYRMVLSIEKLLESEEFTTMIKEMVKISGRATDY